MTFLVTNPDNETDGGTLELDGPSSVISADVGGFTYVFVAGGVDDGISVFRLLANGTLTPVFDVTDDATLKLDGARGLSTAMVDGNTYLFAAGQADNGVSVFRVNTNGSLTNVSNVTDDATMLLAGVSDTATARVGAFTYLYTAGSTENGISIFRVAGDGRLTYLSNQADGGALELAGVRALTEVTIGATAFLIAGGTDDGVSVFSINAATGALTATANVNDTAGINLNDVSAITSTVIGGVTYVFVAGAADNGVSVYSLSAAGALTFIENENDTAATLIAGATSLSISSIGSSTYLLVGGTESGLSMYRVENGSNSGAAAGTLTFVDNIADAGSRELAGTVAVHGVSVGGTNYFLGAGATDDGVSTFGSVATGQLYFLGQGDPTDARLSYMNNDGGNQTSFVDNNPGVDLITGFPEEIGVDTAAGFYFGLVNGGNDGSGARLVRGSLAGGAVTTLVAYDGVNNIIGDSDDEIVNALHVDVINHRIYVGIQDPEGDGPGATGIRQYSYNPLTGAITDLGFLVTVSSSGKPQESGFDVFDVRDFDVDTVNNTMVFTELLTGGVSANGIFRLDLSTPNTVVQLVSQAQFPDSGSAGYITDVEVDSSTHLAYFSVESQHAFPNAGYVAGQNAIYWISDTASGGTATALILNGLPVGGHFYPGDMVFDQATRQLYVESEETDDGSGADTDDVIYVFQLTLDGHTGNLINTISLTPSVNNIAANIGGMIFNDIPLLASVTGTGTHAGEQSTAITLLTGAPTITDLDGDHLRSATVQITQGLFSSNESNATDDVLSVTGAALAGTGITASYDAATGTLTLSGYDTLAHYQQALAGVQFTSAGNNPTNYGLNTTRTITWTVSDGAIGVPGGSQNSATTSIIIDAVNDAPVNTVGATLATTEDLTSVVVSGVSVSDPDANPGITDITVTLTVQHGTITLSTAVAGGIAAGDITGGANGSATITITATANEINATLAGSGLAYTPTGNYNGADTLQIVTNDGGNTGTGGALSDTDSKTITITAVNDPITTTAPPTATVAEDSTNVAVTGLAISDVDAALNPSGVYDVTLSATNGALTMTTLSGLTFTVGDGTGDATMTFHGTLAAVNSALATANYTPTGNYNGSATITLSATDTFGGIVATGTGAATSDSDVVNVTVTAVNDPISTNAPATLTLNEDATNVAVTGLSISDADAALSPAGVYDVTLASTNGTLTLTTLAGLTFTVGDGTGDATMTFHGTLAAINTALATAKYTPAANYNGAAQIQLQATDTFGGVVATGSGAATSDSDTVSVTVTSINDAPTGTDATFSARHGTLHTLTAAEFGFSDVENNAFVSVTITTKPTAGRLLYANGDGTFMSVAAGQVITVADINAGKLVYKPTPGVNDAATGSFTFQVHDDGGTANGGVDTDPSPNTLTFTVPPNLAPDGHDATIGVMHGTPHVLTTADFGFSDPDGYAFAAVTITTGPTAGRLLYGMPDGHFVAVTPGQLITTADIDAGRLMYKPTPGANDPAVGSFTFQVHDDGGTANGGVDTDPTPNTLTFDANAGPAKLDLSAFGVATVQSAGHHGGVIDPGGSDQPGLTIGTPDVASDAGQHAPYHFVMAHMLDQGNLGWAPAHEYLL